MVTTHPDHMKTAAPDDMAVPEPDVLHFGTLTMMFGPQGRTLPRAIRGHRSSSQPL